MPRLVQFDREQLAETLSKQRGILARQQAAACRMTEKAIRHRTRPDGPWQVVLPGIYSAGQGAALTESQRAVAAYLYAGKALAVTGAAAVSWHGIPARRSEFVDVLVPQVCQRSDAGFVRLHRTTVMPVAPFADGVVRYAGPDRAIIDAARQLQAMSDVRALVAAGVQRGKVQVWQLAKELAAGPAAGSARLRIVLAEVGDGVRSVAEADLRTLIIRAHLPTPLYNPELYIGTEFLAMPDVWWEDYGVAGEVDSMEWHLSPADAARTMERHARMTAAGILVLHFAPSQVRKEGPKVAEQLRSALAAARTPLPQIVTVPGR
jgi:hypothetical protein